MPTHNEIRAQLATEFNALLTTAGIGCPTVLNYRTAALEKLPSPILMATEQAVDVSDPHIIKILIRTFLFVAIHSDDATQAAEQRLSQSVEIIMKALKERTVKHTYWIKVLAAAPAQSMTMRIAGRTYRLAEIQAEVLT